MTRRTRLRRAAILCCHTLSNVAYYRAGRATGKLRFNGNMEITIANNFLDVAVVEWCKLFGDKKGSASKRIQQHSWLKIVTDPVAFEVGLLHQLRCSETDFDDFRNAVRIYRDKFLAHLDELETMEVPLLHQLKASAAFYYDYLLRHENDGATFEDAHPSADGFYREREAEGDRYYDRLRARNE